MALSYNNLLEQYSQMAEEAKTSNLARQKTIEKIFDEVIKMYRPGGTFGKGYEAQLGAQKVREVSGAEQSDISRGLFGLRSRGTEWESAVGAPARLKLEDIRMERLSSAQLGKAGFLERIEEPYPDYNALMQASMAQASSPDKEIIRVIKRKQPASGGTTGGGTSQSLSDWMRSTFPAFYSGGTTGGSTTGYTSPTAGAGPTPGMTISGGVPISYTPTSTTAGTTAGATTQQMTATQAMKQFSTYSQFAAWAKGQGLKPGTEAEWAAVKKRIV